MRKVEESDFPAINLWRIARKAVIIPRSLYPSIGFIEPGIAAGFLTLTETKMALMENFITNPHAYKVDRERAVIDIIERLERVAYDYSVKWIIAVTSNPKIDDYADRLGWVLAPCKVYGKELNGCG